MIPWSYFEGDGDHSSLLNTGPISVKASFPIYTWDNTYMGQAYIFKNTEKSIN